MRAPRDYAIPSPSTAAGIQRVSQSLTSPLASDTPLGFMPWTGDPQGLGDAPGGIVSLGSVDLTPVTTVFAAQPDTLLSYMPLTNDGLWLACGTSYLLVFHIDPSTLVLTVGSLINSGALFQSLTSCFVAAVLPWGEREAAVVGWYEATSNPLLGKAAVFMVRVGDDLSLTRLSEIVVADEVTHYAGRCLSNAHRLENGLLAVPVAQQANAAADYTVKTLAFADGSFHLRGAVNVPATTNPSSDWFIGLAHLADNRIGVATWSAGVVVYRAGWYDDLGGNVGLGPEFPVLSVSGLTPTKFSLEILELGRDTTIPFGEIVLAGSAYHVLKAVHDGGLTVIPAVLEETIDSPFLGAISQAKNVLFSWGARNSKVSYFQPDDGDLIGGARLYTWDWDGQRLSNRQFVSLGTAGSSGSNTFIFPHLYLVASDLTSLTVHRVPQANVFNVQGVTGAPVSSETPLLPYEVLHDLLVNETRVLAPTTPAGRLLYGWQDFPYLASVNPMDGTVTPILPADTSLTDFVSANLPAEMPTDGTSDKWFFRSLLWVDTNYFVALCQSWSSTATLWGNQHGMAYGVIDTLGNVTWLAFNKIYTPANPGWEADAASLVYHWADNLFRFFTYQTVENGVPMTQVVRQNADGSFAFLSTFTNGAAGSQTFDVLPMDARLALAFRGSVSGSATQPALLPIGINAATEAWEVTDLFLVPNMLSQRVGPVGGARGLPLAVVDDSHVLVVGADSLSGGGRLSVIHVQELTLTETATYVDNVVPVIYSDPRVTVVGRRYGEHFVVVGADTGGTIKARRFQVNPTTYAITPVGGAVTIVAAYGAGDYEVGFDGYDLLVRQLSGPLLDHLQFTLLPVFDRVQTSTCRVTTQGRCEWPAGFDFRCGVSYWLDAQGSIVSREAEFYLGEAVAPRVLDISPRPFYDSFSYIPGPGRLPPREKPFVRGLTPAGESPLGTSGILVADQSASVFRSSGEVTGDLKLTFDLHAAGNAWAVFPAQSSFALDLASATAGLMLHARGQEYTDLIQGFSGAYPDGRTAYLYRLAYRGHVLDSAGAVLAPHVFRVDQDILGHPVYDGLTLWSRLDGAQLIGGALSYGADVGRKLPTSISPLPPVTSTVFATGQIGQAPVIAGASNPFALPIQQLNTERGCLEFWIKTTDDLAVEVGAVYRFLTTGPWNPSTPDFISFSYVRQGTPGAEAVIHVEYGAGSPDEQSFVLADASHPIQANTWYHMAFVWDNQELDTSGNYMLLFLNGQVITPSAPWPVKFSRANNWLSVFYNPLAPTGLERHWNGSIDNLKMWSYPKLDFRDRYDQGFPYQPVGVPVPLNLTAVEVPGATESLVNLAWEFPWPLPTGVVIERRTGFSGPWSVVTNTTTPSTTTFQDGPLAVGYTIFYRMRSYTGTYPTPAEFSSYTQEVNLTLVGNGGGPPPPTPGPFDPMPTLWNRLESDTGGGPGTPGTITSDIGPNMTAFGWAPVPPPDDVPLWSFGPGKFNNAINIYSSGGSIGGFTSFPGSAINIERGTLEFWLKSVNREGTIFYGNLIDPWDPTNIYDPNGLAIYLGITGQPNHRLIFWWRGVGGDQGVLELAFDAQTHFAVSWDTLGIAGLGGSTKVALFINGVLRAAISTAFNTVSAIDSQIIFAGNGDSSSTWMLDNVRVYDYAKVGFGDKEIPTPPALEGMPYAATLQLPLNYLGGQRSNTFAGYGTELDVFDTSGYHPAAHTADWFRLAGNDYPGYFLPWLSDEGSIALHVPSWPTNAALDRYLWCFSAGLNGQTPDSHFRCYLNSSNHLVFDFGPATTSITSGLVTGNAYDIHCAWKKAGFGNGDTIRIYVNGVATSASQTAITAARFFLLDYLAVLQIPSLTIGAGYNDTAALNPFTAYLQNLRIYTTSDVEAMPSMVAFPLVSQISNFFRISWTPEDALATHFWVYKDEDGSAWSRVGIVAAGGTDYFDYTYTSSNGHRFMVLPVNAAGAGRRWSNPTGYYVPA